MSVETQGERRIVSVLITDVVDSTAIAEQLGTERSKLLFDEVARVTGEQVLLYGGTVAQHTGDGVLAVFGAPLAHGDDAERAVRAALGVHDSLRALAEEISSAYGVLLAARAAVNTGPVAVLAGEQPPDVLYNALGDTVNVAARLQSYALPGGLVVGPVTADEVRGRFDCEPIGALEIKGREGLVEAFRVLGAREESAVPSTPFVGRASERGAVVEAFEGVAEGRGAVVVVTGEVGIGKTRLIDEALHELGGRVRVLEGQGVSYAESFPYWPIRGLLRDWLDLSTDAPEAQVRLELRTGLNRVLGESGADLYPFLAPVAGVPLEPVASARLRELSSDSVRQRTVDALRTLIAEQARGRPLVIVLDDLHWADEATLELVSELFAVADEEGLGLVLGYRSYRDHPAWRLGEQARQRVPHRYLEIELQGLGSADSRALTAALAGAPVPAAVDDLLSRRAGGNPFFLEQSLYDLIEGGWLHRDGDSYRLVRPLDGTSVPWAVQETIQARLDRLAPDTRAVVAAASVVGREFSRPFLEDLLGGASLTGPLSELQRRDLVTETRRRPSAEYRFRHGLVQEVAYASLLENQRRALHRRTAELLEPLVCDCDDDLGLLGHHWAEAGDAARAARYLVEAGDVARRMYADVEAFEHYERALAFQRQLHDDSGARSTLLRLALARHQAFDFVGADAAWAQAFDLPEDLAPRAQPSQTIEIPVLEPDSLVPGVTAFDSTTWVSRHLFTGLLRAAPERGAVMDGAVRVSVSPDGRVYRFGLRPTSRWHDGTPVTAGDYVFAYEGIVAGGLFGTTLLGHVESVAAIDDLELELRLNRPLTHLPHMLSFAMLFPWPRHLWSAGPPTGLTPHELVGNGPFRLAEADTGQLRLVAADTWDLPRGNVAEVRMPIVRAGPSLADVARSWSEGRFDLAFNVTAGPDSEEAADTVRQFFPKSGVQSLAFNGRGPLSDQRLRVALARALPVFEDYGSSVRAVGGLIPPAVLAHTHDLGVERDVDLAVRLLADAGYPGGAGLRPLLLALPAELEGPVGDASRYVEAWAEIGVRLEVVRPAYNTMSAVLAADATDAWVFGWAADSPDSVGFLEAYLAAYPTLTQPDETLRALLDRAAASTDRDERNALCRAFERGWIAEQAALKPLMYVGSVAVTRPYVHGFWTSFSEAPTADQLDIVRS